MSPKMRLAFLVVILAGSTVLAKITTEEMITRLRRYGDEAMYQNHKSHPRDRACPARGNIGGLCKNAHHCKRVLPGLARGDPLPTVCYWQSDGVPFICCPEPDLELPTTTKDPDEVQIREVIRVLRGKAEIYPDIRQRPADRSCPTNKFQKGICKNIYNCRRVLRTAHSNPPNLCYWRASDGLPIVCCPEDPEPFFTTRPPYVIPDRGDPDFEGETSPPDCIDRPSSRKCQIVSGTSACGQQAIQPKMVSRRIVGGTESTPHSWPWMVEVHLELGSTRTFRCGGALISPTDVITAAHCFDGIDLNRVTVLAIVGSHKLGQGTQRRVQSVIPHPRYREGKVQYDIAVLHTEQAVPLSTSVVPICLPPADWSSYSGLKCIAVGWGFVTARQPVSDVLREVEVPVIDKRNCSRAYSRTQVITDHMLCAGNGSGDTCQGDSGGPLLAQDDNKWIIVGVVSFGMQCADPNHPGVYTKVTSFLTWIHEQTSSPIRS